MSAQAIIDEIDMVLEGAWIATEAEEVDRTILNENGSGIGAPSQT
ncbi:hypothetical protein [Actinacidiphila sp. bgisy167]